MLHLQHKHYSALLSCSNVLSRYFHYSYQITHAMYFFRMSTPNVHGQGLFLHDSERRVWKWITVLGMTTVGGVLGGAVADYAGVSIVGGIVAGAVTGAAVGTWWSCGSTR